MTTRELHTPDLTRLKSKTVVVTGGATGIGRATVRLLHEHGANIVLADWNETEANALLKELRHPSSILFTKTNVARWEDIRNAFQAGYKKFSSIDAIISNAGINSAETLLDFDLDKENGSLLPPKLDSLEINLIGHIYMVRCAMYYFEKSKTVTGCIVLTASAAAFLDTPPLYIYSIAKAGLLGLMRSLRTTVTKQNVTINAVAPWMTMSPMVPQALVDLWGNLPSNTGDGVARGLVHPICNPSINGKTFFVAGNTLVEVEDAIAANEHLIFGKELSEQIKEGQRRLLTDNPFT